MWVAHSSGNASNTHRHLTVDEEDDGRRRTSSIFIKIFVLYFFLSCLILFFLRGDSTSDIIMGIEEINAKWKPNRSSEEESI